MAWANVQGLPARSFDCGYCSNRIASALGYAGQISSRPGLHVIFICPNCQEPTYFDSNGRQVPGVCQGASIAALPKDIETAYNEARNCMSISAYTAAALILRKILMHIAVDCGAVPNLTFKGHVDYLVANHYVPPNGEVWVGHIRDKGNELNHQLTFASNADAKDLIGFVELLLKFIYEFPSRIGAKGSAPATS